MKTLLQISIFMLTAALMSCTGDDGDPGPAGQDGTTGAQGSKGDKGDKGDMGEQGLPGEDELKSGFISGTISGVRQDKTAFEETFKYEYVSDADGFGANDVLSVGRTSEGFGRSGYTYMQIAFEEKNNASLPMYLTSLSFDFSKELSPSKLFIFKADINDINIEEAITAQYPLLTANNDEYQINYNRAYRTIDGQNIYYSAFTDDNSFVFYTLDGKTVHYDDAGVAAGDYKKYALINVTDAAGNVVNAGAFAGTSFFIKNVGHGSYITDEGGNNLSGLEIWDFSETITDYRYDMNAGVATFNYSITLPAPLNSTGHAATLTGSAEVKVYSETASRIAGGN